MRCLKCGANNEMQTCVDPMAPEGTQPRDGDMTMCFTCYHLHMYTNNATALRELTAYEIIKHQDVIEYANLIKEQAESIKSRHQR